MKTVVMVNGLPGKMAMEVAASIKANSSHSEEGFKLAGYSLTSNNQTEGIAVGAERDVKHVKPIRPDQREECIRKVEIYEGRTILSVDYTVPDAVNGNADFYCRHGLPFVMGTTGGDRNALEARVRDSDVVAVIAPNMAKQIVALQAMFAYGAETFPGAFRGYELQVQESHQASKKDTSGTAKAMIGYLKSLGVDPFDMENRQQLIKWRDPIVQEELLGVPREHLGGHGWHTYDLKSSGVSVGLWHDIDGRTPYVDGTLDALRFLQRKVEAGERGRVYSMIDVLKEG